MNTPKILTRDQMTAWLQGADTDLLERIAHAFRAYSAGRATVPPPGELLFSDPPGDTHIKYGAIAGEPLFVVKVASSFYRNPELGLSSSQGAMLAFESTTGRLRAVLLDDGLLTDVRTAVAGALAAKALAPRGVERIGILGTGIQARLQAHYLKTVVGTRELVLWGRNEARVRECRSALEADGFHVTVAETPAALAGRCRLIVTTTPATSPLLQAVDIAPGTHITAVGADTATKQELESALFARAERVVTDSFAQCRERGDISHALRGRELTMDAIVELGTVLAGQAPGRPSASAITICDLTGVAVQDLAIAQYVIERAG